MNSDFVFAQLRTGLLAIIAYGAGAGWFTPQESTLFVALITAFGPLLVPVLMSFYANWNMKKIPTNSVAAAVDKVENLPGISPEKIAQVAKVAATATAMLFALMLFNPAPANAQNRTQLSVLAGNPVVQFFANWGKDDIAAAEKLAIDFKDDIGLACWQTFAEMGDVINAHPLPVTFKLASDIQAARLFVKAIKKVCLKPECSQMWNDLQNQIGAFTPIPLPISLASVCAKIP